MTWLVTVKSSVGFLKAMRSDAPSKEDAVEETLATLANNGCDRALYEVVSVERVKS